MKFQAALFNSITFAFTVEVKVIESISNVAKATPVIVGQCNAIKN